MSKRPCKLLVAAAGSVAAKKVPILIKSLLDLSLKDRSHIFELHLIVTRCAKHFFKTTDLPIEVKLYDDDLEWTWNKKGDTIWHVELVKQADMMVIAPLNANTMSKIANGMCDNILTSTVRAWDMKKPVLFCPAMNVRMWEHPITTKHVETLKQWGFVEVPPVCKTLMCDSVGVGAMADIKEILKIIIKVADSKLKHGS